MKEPHERSLSGLGSDLLDPSLPTPLYHQAFLVLRDRIRAGIFPTDSVLPGEQELTKLFGVSRITVKRAMNELAAAGLVTRHRGRGTVVTFNATIPAVKGSFDNLIESLRFMGLETDVELLDLTTVSAAGDIANQLDVEIGTPLQRAVRLRKLSGEPFSYLVTHVPADIASHWSEEELGSIPLLTLLDRAGASAVEARQTIGACAAEASIAQALKIAPGSPLLEIVRVMLMRGGRAVQLIQGYYRPERFQYQMRMVKKLGAWGVG
jgi:GntR family transcriptional regulator